MSTIVTLNVFSGRPNPTWELSGEDLEHFLDRVQSTKLRTDRKPSGVFGRLGYRGFTINRSSDAPEGQQRFYVHEGIVDPGRSEPNLVTDDRELEAFLLETGGERLDEAVREHVLESLERRDSADDLLKLYSATGCPPNRTQDAPVYDPGRWNIPSVQPYNNCYNYANDQITNTFAQPGRATGRPITSLSCGGVRPSAESDGLRVSPNFSDPLGPGQGWYVALVIWPRVDYHWYRQDKNGCWSHKPGQTAVRNTDDSGQPITDPRTANRGPYTDFCTYMITDRNVRIR